MATRSMYQQRIAQAKKAERTHNAHSNAVVGGNPSVQAIMQMQRVAGNRAVSRMLNAVGVVQRQPTLVENAPTPFSIGLPGLEPDNIDEKEAKRRANEYHAYLEDYHDRWGYYPWERAKHVKQVPHYESKPSEPSKPSMTPEEKYLRDTRHGGFEKRAAKAVGRVKRDKKERIVNYGEVTRQSIEKIEGDEWVVVDHEAFGPYISGSAGRSGIDNGPYSTANPECADPQVQDDLHYWLQEQREKDKSAGRQEDRVDMQHYDDKEPCEQACSHNIPEQARLDNVNIDLFLSKKANETEGIYSGASYKRTHRPDDPRSEPGYLKIRGQFGKTKETHRRDLENQKNKVKTAVIEQKIQVKKRIIERKETDLKNLEEKLQKISEEKEANNEQDIQKLQLEIEQLKKGIQNEIKGIEELQEQLELRAKIEKRIDQVEEWPDLRKK